MGGGGGKGVNEWGERWGGGGNEWKPVGRGMLLAHVHDTTTGKAKDEINVPIAPGANSRFADQTVKSKIVLTVKGS